VTRALIVALCLGLSATTSVAAEGGRLHIGYQAVRESLRYLPPNIRSYCLEKAGYHLWPEPQARPGSGGLSFVGKWGAGPSYRVAGRDSIIYLSRGSQVAIINFADTANPRVLSYIEAPGLVARSVLVGSRLYVSSGYIETFDVSNPANPIVLGSVLVRAPAMDVVDTLVYTLYQDSFKIFNFANPANPQMVGAYSDSGYDLSVCNGYAYIGDRWGLYVLDVTNPLSPHRIASWGSDVISVKARANICCATTGNPNDPTWLQFAILDVRTPSNPSPLSIVDSCGGYDIYLQDSLAFLSGYYTGGYEFQILSIADSTRPRSIGGSVTRGDNDGVWANPKEGTAFVADDFEGLQQMDISTLSAPRLVRTTLGADMACDITVDGARAYVADDRAGLHILDVTDPTRPTEIGVYDTLGFRPMYNTVAARDSFAFVDSRSGGIRFFRAVDITDPADPEFAGDCELFNPPEDIELRDSFAYVAEVNRFQVVNVARSREPKLVGSCDSQDGVYFGLALQDTLAYIAADGLQLVSIARPDSPAVVNTVDRTALGVAVRDTFVYLPYVCDTLLVYSAADPADIRLLASVPTGVYPSDVALGELRAYVSSVSGIDIYGLDNPAQPVHIGRVTAPVPAYRLAYASGLLYAALQEAGMAIYETTSVGISEQTPMALGMPRALRVWPSVTGGEVRFTFGSPLRSSDVSVYDISGKRLGDVRLRTEMKGGATKGVICLASQAAGVYVIRVESEGKGLTTKVVKSR
jgi:hypothetical protein